MVLKLKAYAREMARKEEDESADLHRIERVA